MKITKAVIPAAGLGTRMLPIARCVPKEVLPIVDKPTIAYLVEEAADSGITDILIITGRGKYAMEEYFDFSPEYEQKLRASGREDEIEKMRELTRRVNVSFIRQHETKGLGHAISRARSFTGNEPFCVLYGDDVIISEKPVCRALIDVYEKHGKAVAGVKAVPLDLIGRYCSLDAKKIDDEVYDVRGMIEKPSPDRVITNLAILGRVLLTPEIYDILDKTEPGAGGEIQLTDAMNVLAKTRGMNAIEFEGTRYDIGSKLGLMRANVEMAVRHPEIGEQFKEYLREFVKTL